MDYLNDRQSLILSALQEKGKLGIQEIQERFGIPQATAYRDVRFLEQQGLARRVRGGLRLEQPDVARQVQPPDCVHCGNPVPARTAFQVRLEAGETLHACCPHCGLMALESQPEAVSALSADYLYGNMVNVRQAAFLVESEVRPCCAPSVLTFASQDDARRFQTGFGGQIMDFELARQAVARIMSLNHPLGHPH